MSTRPSGRKCCIGEAYARNGLENRVGQSIHQYWCGIMVAVVLLVLIPNFQKEDFMSKPNNASKPSKGAEEKSATSHMR